MLSIKNGEVTRQRSPVQQTLTEWIRDSHLGPTYANTSVVTSIEGDHLDLVSTVELVNRRSVRGPLEGDDQVGRILRVLRDELESKTSVGSGY